MLSCFRSLQLYVKGKHLEKMRKKNDDHIVKNKNLESKIKHMQQEIQALRELCFIQKNQLDHVEAQLSMKDKE
jgi:hypothetical protein